ncbi:type I restriction enzyme S subunit [Novosphingobium sp. GV055]|nr:type I restriction enzyme S subunit [Novosphingobium sp. GV055]PUB05763.1 type I restriction enzyme S subunit [Novosphingobium sp. GV061]PUB21996.1 type I restriction enzyme S subunit [Novosphingobium sp. GV079]PUB43769.1 type I restriction enzyme S subunit [Novosphingobium sp. GV027]
MFVGHPGDIVFSKIDARLGAIGVIPESIGTAVVTAEYPIHTPAPDALDADYLKMVLRTGHFIADLRQKASGTSGRKRVTPEAFRSMRVPCPGIDDQRALVAAYQAALAQAEALEVEAGQLEADGLRAFEKALGIVAPPPLPDRPVFVARFSDLGRWSHEAVLRHVTGTEPPPSPYPIVALEDVIADLENGWSPQCLTRPADGEEWGVLKVSAVSSGTFKANENKALPPQLAARPGLEVRAGDVLIARASGAASLVGQCCYVEAPPPRLMVCDKIFRVIPFASSPVNLRFLAQVLRTDLVRRQILGEFSTESGMMKNVTKPVLLGLTFPMPSDLAVQTALVADLNAAHAAAAARRGRALITRHDAWRVFETAIYGEASEPSGAPLSEDSDESEFGL